MRAAYVRRFGRLLRRTIVSALFYDNCLGIAKGAAYSSLLAFFPVLTSVAALLVQANAESVSRILSGLLFEVIPPGTEDLVLYTFTIRGQRPVALLFVATLLSIWAASGVMISLMEGFRAAYRIPRGRPFIRERAVAILLVFAAAVPVLGASALIVFGEATETYLSRALGVIPKGEHLVGGLAVLGQFIRLAIALGSISLATSLLYYFGPNRPQRWRATWPGALLATVLWLVTTMAFAWYVRNIANYNVMYGSIGAVIALLVWMYLLAVIALIGCEFNAERERMALEAVDAARSSPLS
jgi:membrane protein